MRAVWGAKAWDPRWFAEAMRRRSSYAPVPPSPPGWAEDRTAPHQPTERCTGLGLVAMAALGQQDETRTSFSRPKNAGGVWSERPKVQGGSDFAKFRPPPPPW